MAKGDATGWKRGSGPYSKNYAKFNTDGAFPSIERQSAHKGADLSGAVGKRQGVNDGFSGEVSKGKRPSHKAGSWKRA